MPALRLTQFSHGGGCGCKIAPNVLQEILAGTPFASRVAAAFPDLLTFHDAPTAVEQKLFVMFLEHRMRAFQGTFHANPDYALWYGWSEMQRDLTEIKTIAAEMRRKH